MTAGVRAMAPSMIENTKKDFIMTKEEAKLLSKKKKGYAYVAVAELAPKTQEPVAEVQVKRTRHGGARRPDSPPSAKQEDSGLAGKDLRGLKRKAGREDVQEIHLQGDVVFIGGDNHGLGGFVEGEKDKAWKREMRKRLKMELQEIESAKLKLSDKLMNGLAQGSGSTLGKGGLIRGGNGVHSAGVGLDSGRWPAGAKPEIHPAVVAKPVLGSHWDGHGGHLNSLQVGDGTPGVAGREKRTPKTSTKLTDFMTGAEKKPVVVEKPKGKGVKGGGKKGHAKQRKEQKRIQGSGLDECMRIISKLMAQKVAQVYFNAPVDPVALGIPDYFTIIKNPMDFLTIKQKLEGGIYGHPREFEDDVRLVFANCFTYNAPEHEAHKCGQYMLKIFERLWKPLREMLANEGQEGAVEDWGAGGEIQYDEGEESKRKRQKVAGSQDVKGGPLRGTKAAGEGKEMSFDEKRKLSVNLGKLPSEKLGKIVAIISARNPDFGGNGDEIELDIDSLDDDTLWELQRYVANCMKSKSKDKRREELREVVEPSAVQNRIAQEGHNEDEDIDIIAADDGPAGNILPVPAAVSESSSGSSSGESSSSESDSDSGSSSGSESEQDVQSADAGSGTPAHPPDKVTVREGGASGAGRGPTGTSAPQPDSGKRVSGDGDATSSLKEVEVEHISPQQEEVVPVEEARKSSSPAQELSPEEDLRRKELMGKFAHVIAKANVEVELAAKQAQGANSKADPDKVRRDPDEKERLERLERERLKREAAKAEEARKKALIEAQAEKLRKIEAERQAHRQRLQEMEKTVEIDGSMEALKEIELLRNTSFPAQEHPPSSGEPSSPSSSDGPEGEVDLQGEPGGFTLEKLGLFMKDDEEDEDEVEQEELAEDAGAVAINSGDKMEVQPAQAEELEEGEV